MYLLWVWLRTKNIFFQRIVVRSCAGGLLILQWSEIHLAQHCYRLKTSKLKRKEYSFLFSLSSLIHLAYTLYLILINIYFHLDNITFFSLLRYHRLFYQNWELFCWIRIIPIHRSQYLQCTLLVWGSVLDLFISVIPSG